MIYQEEASIKKARDDVEASGACGAIIRTIVLTSNYQN